MRTPLPWKFQPLQDDAIIHEGSEPNPTRQNPDKVRKFTMTVVGKAPAGACGDPDCCPQGDVLVLSQEDGEYIVEAANNYEQTRASLASCREALRKLVAAATLHLHIDHKPCALCAAVAEAQALAARAGEKVANEDCLHL